jgi:hypothetical protein
MATEYEIVTQSVRPVPPPKPQTVAAVQSGPGLESESATLLKTLIEKIEAMGRGNRGNGNCFNCRKPGHYQRECPEKKRERNDRQTEKPLN